MDLTVIEFITSQPETIHRQTESEGKLNRMEIAFKRTRNYIQNAQIIIRMNRNSPW